MGLFMRQYGLALILAVAAIGQARAEPAVEGVDHVPLAVNDLDQAVADFRKLGFVLKPGRSHDDGIRNAHVKFRDGTEIELITVSTPTDELASSYKDWLKARDGPAHWRFTTRICLRLQTVSETWDITPSLRAMS